MNCTDDQRTMSIGHGDDVFDVKISIENFHNQLQITSNSNPCWLSYRFLGEVLQSEILSLSPESFSPMMHSFRIRSSFPELVEHFSEKKNAALRVYVCTNGQVLGTVIVDLLPLFRENDNNFDNRVVHGEYDVIPSADKAISYENDATPARLVMSLYLDRGPRHSDRVRLQTNQSSVTVRSSISSQTDPAEKPSKVMKDDCVLSSTEIPTDSENDGGNSVLQIREKRLEEKEKELTARESQLHKREKEVHESSVALEKKRCEWEQWRHQEEFKWHEKLRNKEAALMRSIEDRVCSIENERLRSLETSRSEYEKLESRLRSALLEVESKERHLKEVEAMHQNEQKRKMAELDLREKLMKEELKHTVEIERAKTNAAMEQAVAVEKSLAAAGTKMKNLEDEIDDIRAKHRSTPEVALLQQLAEIKGQLADSERRIESIKAEKAEIVLEKEQFRASVNKLAKALRREREMAIARRDNNREQQVRLSFDSDNNAFVLGGNQDEVQRILSDLSNLSKLQTPNKSSFSSPSKQSKQAQQLSTNEFGSMSLHNAPPMPSPQPTRPNCTSPVPSIISSSCGYSLDFDKIISSPS